MFMSPALTRPRPAARRRTRLGRAARSTGARRWSVAPRRTTLASLVGVLCALLLFGVPAQAQTDTPPVTNPPGTAPSDENRWGISPSGEDPSQPGARAAFTYDAAPGTTVEDSVTVWNYSDQALTFEVFAKDAFNTPAGGFDVQADDTAPSGVGSWVALENSRVKVEPRTGYAIKFVVTIPSDATPGDHAGGLVVSLATVDGAVQEKSVAVDHRVGTRMYIRVPGPLNPALAIEDLSTSYRGVLNPLGRGELDVTFTVRNVGNVRLSGDQQVTVAGALGIGAQERTLEDLPELLPGSSVTYSTTFVDVIPAFLLTTDVSVAPLQPSGTADLAPESATASSSTWAIPWSLVVLLALVVGASVWRRRRRSHGPERNRQQKRDGGGSGARRTGEPVPAGAIERDATGPPPARPTVPSPSEG